MAKTPVDDVKSLEEYSVEKAWRDDESGLDVLCFKGPGVSVQVRVYNAFDRNEILRMLVAAYARGKRDKQEEVCSVLGVENVFRKRFGY